MKTTAAVFLLALHGSAVTGIEVIFNGSLPFNLYSNGNGCVDEYNHFFAGEIVSLVKMIDDEDDDAQARTKQTFCEKDVLFPFPHNVTLYTKIEIHHVDDERLVNSAAAASSLATTVNVKVWDCSSSDCSHCDLYPEAEGTTNVASGNFTTITPRQIVEDCFNGWWPSISLDFNSIVFGFEAFVNDETTATTVGGAATTPLPRLRMKHFLLPHQLHRHLRRRHTTN